MVLIENNGNYVKVDLTAFILSGKVDYSIYYIMKDQTVVVRLEKNNLWVEVELSNGQILQLDQSGVRGLPAKVGNSIPLNNIELADELANLKNL